MNTPAVNLSVSLETAARLLRDLSYLTEGGLTGAEAVSVLLENGDAGGGAGLLQQLRIDLDNKAPLSAALERHGATFTAETIALVRMGEAQNALSGVLAMLADDFDKRMQMRRSLPAILLWPATLVFFLGLITMVLLIFVVPAFKQVFTSFGADLPALTLLIMGVSDVFVESWYIGVILAVALVFGIAWLRRREAGIKIDEAFIKIPGLRRFLAKQLAARAAALLSGAAASQIPFGAAIAYLRSTLRNRYVKSLMAELEADLTNGVAFPAAWRKQTLLPRGIAQMADIGARSGRMPQVLARAAHLLGIDAEDSISIFRQSLLIATYILIGLMVGITVIAMYLPIFKLGSII